MALLPAAAKSRKDAVVSDSTLRIDLLIGANNGRPEVMVRKMSKSKGWYGRPHNHSRMELKGNGRVTLTSDGGDSIYCSSFSSLANEWLMANEALSGGRPEVFEHTALVPLPKSPCFINVEIDDTHHQTIASARWLFDPKDILVADQTLPCRYETRLLHGNSNESTRRIDVAIVGEGYTMEEKAKFFSDAQRVVDAMMTHPVFYDNRDRFNYIAVATTSDQSGVSVPLENHWRTTAFGSHFSTLYSDRYLTVPDIFHLHDALAGVPYEHIIVVANTDKYGGGGIFNDYALTAADHPLMPQVIVHEFGHSFGGLADEYFYVGDVMDDTYPIDVEPWEPNVTTLTDFRGKWENLIEGENASCGLVEGAAYSFKGIFRAAEDCRMKTNESPDFCPACNQALQRMIDFYTVEEVKR